MKNLLLILVTLCLVSFTAVECSKCAFYKSQYVELLKKTSTCEELLIENDFLMQELKSQKAHIKVLRDLVDMKLKGDE